MTARVHQYVRASAVPGLKRLIAATGRTGTDVLTAAVALAERCPAELARDLADLGPGQKPAGTGRRHKKKVVA